MADLKANFPDIRTPFINKETGQIDVVWWQFLISLFVRSGSESGNGDPNNDQAIRILQQALLALQASVASTQVIQAQFRIATPESAVASFPVEALYQINPPIDVPAHGLQIDELLHALVTPATHGFMAALDKAKLDLLRVTVAPVDIVADMTNANNTADANILAITVPGGTFAAGSLLNFRVYSIVSSAAAAGTLSVWIKLGATKILTQTFTLPALGQTNQGMFYTASLTIRTIGAGGTLKVASLMTSNNNSLNGGPVVGNANSAIDTTASNTFTIGWNWSVANAGNTSTAHTASILQEK